MEGKVTLLEYTLLRNLVIVIISMAMLKVDPFEALPAERRPAMLGRAFCGLSVSLLINQSLELIPFSLLVILFQTNPFWTSILSYFVNKEQIFFIEVVGMIVCFAAVITIVTN